MTCAFIIIDVYYVHYKNLGGSNMTKQLTIRSNEKLITIVTDNHETLDRFIKWLYEYRVFDEIIGNNYTVSSEKKLIACKIGRASCRERV